MNERIRELAEQSGAGWDDKYHWYVSNEQMKKFAELIVRECAKLADEPSSQPCNSYGEKIRQHFGVE